MKSLRHKDSNVLPYYRIRSFFISMGEFSNFYWGNCNVIRSTVATGLALEHRNALQKLSDFMLINAVEVQIRFTWYFILPHPEHQKSSRRKVSEFRTVKKTQQSSYKSLQWLLYCLLMLKISRYAMLQYKSETRIHLFVIFAFFAYFVDLLNSVSLSFGEVSILNYLFLRPICRTLIYIIKHIAE